MGSAGPFSEILHFCDQIPTEFLGEQRDSVHVWTWLSYWSVFFQRKTEVLVQVPLLPVLEFLCALTTTLAYGLKADDYKSVLKQLIQIIPCVGQIIIVSAD